MTTTTSKNCKVLTVGYGRHLFAPDNPERKRLAACAAAVSELHVIVFTSAADAIAPVHDGALHIYPTAARSRWGQLTAAIKLGVSIIPAGDSAWVVSSQDPFEAGLVGYRIARRRGVPLNVQEHGDFFSTPHWRQDEPLNQVRYWFGRWLLRRATTVRVVSNRIRVSMERLGVLASRIHHLPVRSDQTESQAPQPYDYGFDASAVVVLTMARLVRQKNLPLLLRSFKTVITQAPMARLVIVGAGSEEAHLRRLVVELELAPYVQFISWSDNPAEHFVAADIFALSSDWEGWARTLVEALRFGVPVVTTDVGCAGEVVHDGQHGFVVPVRDESAFTESLQRLVLDVELRKQYGTAGAAAATSQTETLATYAERWAQVLNDTAIADSAQ